MSKSTKSKKDKVPKITEEEYTAYLAALREVSLDRGESTIRPPLNLNRKPE